jgi:hypothetical protein
MKLDWSPLHRALAACRRDNIAVPFWWRDDDAIALTPALDRLMTLSVDTDLPVHLAIIPAHADPALVGHIDTNSMIPVVHGWAHTDHSAGVGKKNEFQTARTDAVSDANQAMDRMRALFGASLRPMFVPPWNRINDDVVRALPALGYSALSTFNPRCNPIATIGLEQINTHIDPIWWKGTRDLVEPDVLIEQAAQHLDARRTGREDKDEPLGLLTHHLVHTDAIWDFTAGFAQEMLAGGATPWGMENNL